MESARRRGGGRNGVRRAGDALLLYEKRQTSGRGSVRTVRVVRRFHPWEVTARRAGEDQRALQNGNGRRGLRSHPHPTGVGVGRIEGVRSDGSGRRVRCTAVGVEIPPRLGRVRDDKGGRCAESDRWRGGWRNGVRRAGDALLPYGKRQTTGPGSLRIGRVVRRIHPWEVTARRAFAFGAYPPYSRGQPSHTKALISEWIPPLRSG